MVKQIYKENEIKERTVEDTRIKNLWTDYVASPVEQGVRDLFGYSAGEKVGDFLKPETNVRNGVEVSPDNKIFNSDSPEQMKTFIAENVVPSDDPDDRHLYLLRNPQSGEYKFGTSEGPVSKRYANDMDFQSWVVEYDAPTKNAEDIENRIHGNTALFSEQGKGNTLRSGNTERVGPELAKEYFQTLTQKKGFDAVGRILSDEQKALTTKVRRGSLDVKGFIADLQQTDSETGLLGSLSTEGGITLDELNKAPQYVSEARKTMEHFGQIDTSMLTDEQVTEWTNDFVNKINWNMVDLGLTAKKANDLGPEAAEALLNVMEMYDTTDATLGQFAGGVKNLFSDPATYMTVGGLVSAPAKEGLKEALKYTAKVGAVEGGLYGGLDDAGRQTIETTATGEDFDVARSAKATAIGAGAGAVLGPLITILSSTPRLLPSAKKRVKENKEAVEEEIKQNPELREQAIKVGLIGEDYPVFKKKVEVEETVTKEKMPEKRVVKGEKKKPIKDKTGKVRTEEALKEQKDIMEKSTSKIVEPRQHTGEKVEGQVEVPEKDQEFSNKIGWDFRLRTYDERGKAINFQGGNEAKFSQAIQDRPKVTDIDAEIERRMKIYDSEKKLQESYGSTQALLKEAVKETGEAKKIANRRSFERDNLWQMAHDKTLSKKLRRKAAQAARKIDKVVDYKMPREVKEKAEQKFKKQFEQYSAEEDYKKRAKRQKDKFEARDESPQFRKKKEKYLETKKEDMAGFLDRQIKELEPKWRKASQSVEELSEAKGMRYSPTDRSSELSQHQKVIDEYTDLVTTKDEYESGEIGVAELQFRMKELLEKRQFEQAEKKFKNTREYNVWKKEQQAMQAELGLNERDLPGFKEEYQPDYSKAKSGEIEIKFREKKLSKKKPLQEETEEGSKFMHKARVGAIKKGTAELTYLERELLDRGIEPELVANIKSPIGRPSDLRDLREQWKTKLITQASNHQRTALGIKEVPVQKVKKIMPTDSTTDFSNSVGQNVALVTGDKDIGDVTKLTGTKEDIRENIAKIATKMLGREIKKDDIKPLFMQQLYGQMERGLVKEVKGDQELFDAYDAVMKTEYPVFYELSNTIYNLGELHPTGMFKYRLPDADIAFSLQGFRTGTVNIGKDKTQTLKVGTHSYNPRSRALLPNIMHSIDGYIIRRMVIILGREGMDTRTIHDALTFKTEHSDRVKEVALQVHKEILDSDILHNIMVDIGYKGEPIKSMVRNKLTAADLDKSVGKAMDFEHIAGKVEEEDAVRANENSRLLSDKELVKEYMASSNVKLAGTNQLLDYMITEAGFNTKKYATARTSDDAFELAVAEALQGKATTRLIPPKELSKEGKKLWIKNTRELIREARAKAERNPMLVGYIQGKRKYFDENGRSLLSPDRKTLEQIKTNEMRTYRKLLKSKTRKEIKIIESIEPNLDFEKMQKKVYQWKDTKLTEEQQAVKKLVEETKMPEETGYTKSFFRDQVRDTPESKEFDQLSMIYKTESDNVAKMAELMQKEMDKMIPEEDREDFTKHLLDTDYHEIQELKSKEEAAKYKEQYKEIYKRAEQHIVQGAKAINEDSQQIGAFINNPLGIARHTGLPEDTAQIIDKLISIEAMTDDAWKWINERRKTKEYKFAMNVIEEKKRKSKQLFANNPEDYVKGYMTEHYDGSYKIENQKVMLDADSKRTLGIIPIVADAKKVGSPSKIVAPEELPSTGFATRQEMIDFALENEMKITDKGLRKVQNKKLREEAGRSRDFNKILTDTTASVEYKMAQRNIVKNIQNTAMQESKLISNGPKEGFRELAEDEAAMLPIDLKEVIKYVNQEYAERLMGREEFRIYKGDRQTFKVADRVWMDLVKRFKQNVVLKNTASHMNAIIVNQSLGATVGLSPVKNAKYAIEASKQMEANLKIMKKLALAKAEGRQKEVKSLQSKLEQSELWKMEQMGLSTNLLEGVRGNNALINDILSKATKGYLDRATNIALANQGSVIGDIFAKSFSHIDTQGRYALTKHFMSKGKSMEQAVKEANGLFGDMDKMAPAMIEAIDKYGMIPFMKWFSLTTPMLMKIVKNNPLKAMAVSIAMLYLSDALNWNNASQNPIGAAVDFAEQGVTTDVFKQIETFGATDVAIERMKPYVIPSLYRKGWNAATEENKHMLFSEQIKKPRTEDFPDYRGLTQQTIDLFKED